MKVKKIVLFYVMLMVLSVSARAQSIKPENAGPLSASKLYWMLGAGSELYVYDNISSGVAYSSVWKNTDFTGNTLAIGPYYPSGTWGVGNAVLVAYFWNWDNTGVKITRVIPNPTGAATIQQFTVPRPSATVSWSGGEVNQITGEIYFSSREDATIQSNFRLGIYNPYTGTFKDSGKLQAKTATEAIEGTVYSDMAIDSDGNAYIMIHESSNNCTLVRVEVGENGAGWKYSKVKRFTSSNLFYVDTWGMAFLNGKLYVTGAQDRVVEINPLTGVSTNKGNPGHDIFDLASAQTAIVVRGRVYNDLDGDGVISTLEQSVTTSGSPSLAGDTIEIYDAAKNYKGFTTTNSGGEYFLMLDLDNTDYYIRLKRPRINGIKGVQTYAWAGTVTNQHSSYTVTAYSRDAQGNPVELTAEGPCTGVHDGNDPNTTNLNDARFYSKIHIGHNITGVVDFGITAMSDLGDAPYQSTFAGETTGAAAPVHFTYGKKLYLGNDVSTDNPTGATSVSAGVDDATDDGVWLVLEGQNIALSDTVLEANTTYTIKVKTSGPERLSGYLNVFTSCPNSGTISTTNMNSAFQTGFKVATNLQSTAGNDTITFTYTVPNDIPLGKNTTYMRFRFSNVPGLNATGNPDPAATGGTWWTLDGEVEDYRVYLRKRDTPAGSVTAWPTSASLTYGQSLGEAQITGGTSNVTDGGHFEFKNIDVYPTAANSNLTEYPILFIPTNYNKYTPIEKTGGMKVTVNPKNITASNIVVADKFFDNTTSAYVKNVSFAGLIFNDVLVKGTDYTATGAFADPSAGNNKSVDVTVTLNNTSVANNYFLTAPFLSKTANILHKTIDDRGIAIGTDNEQGLSYAILDLNSDCKGFRLPRLTDDNRNALNISVSEPDVAESAEGLLFFNSNDNNLQYWNGAEWRAIDGAVISWTQGISLPKEPADVVIGSVANDADYFALLKIESDCRGVRLPWVRTNVADALIQVNGGGKQGLLIYNTDENSIQYWNGTNWISLAGSTIRASISGTRPDVAGVNIGDGQYPPFHSELAFAESTAEKAIQLPCLSVAARNNLLTGANATEQAAAAGLIIFNTDTENLEFFDGVGWKKIE